jgi:hypothetical protein
MVHTLPQRRFPVRLSRGGHDASARAAIHSRNAGVCHDGRLFAGFTSRVVRPGDATSNRPPALRRSHTCRLVQGTAIAISPDARSAAAAGLSLALVGRNELRADVIGAIRRSAVGEFTKKKVRVSMDVALTNLLTNASLVAPTFPTPPVGTSGVLLFPFATTVTAGSGNVAPSPDWDGAPINFFNDTDAGCSL